MTKTSAGISVQQNRWDVFRILYLNKNTCPKHELLHINCYRHLVGKGTHGVKKACLACFSCQPEQTISWFPWSWTPTCLHSERPPVQGPKGKLTTKLSNKRETAVTSGCKMLALNTEHFYAMEFLGVWLEFFEGWGAFLPFFFFSFGSD